MNNSSRLLLVAVLLLIANSANGEETNHDTSALLLELHTQQDETKWKATFERLKQFDQSLVATQAFEFFCDNSKVVDEGWPLLMLLSDFPPSTLAKAVMHADGRSPERSRIPTEFFLRLAIRKLDPNSVSTSWYQVLRPLVETSHDMNLVRVVMRNDPHRTFTAMWRRHGKTLNAVEARQATYLAHLLESYEFRKNLDYPTAPVRKEVGSRMAKLLDHELWWVRLYAVEVMQRNPNLRSTNLNDCLGDSNKFVASRCREIYGKEPKGEGKPLVNFNVIPNSP